MKKLSRQDLEDILHGAAILGTGGGGELSEGFAMIDDALAKGKEFIMVDLDEAPQDALVCTPYMLGAISALPEEEEKLYERLPRSGESSILAAYARFETYLGRKFYGTISCELGGSNTAASFYAAAMAGAYIIDADPAGRAVPEITHSTYYINGLPAAPIVMANEFGEAIICENVMDDARAEHIVRALSMVSRNDIAAIDHALEVREIRDAVIPGAISLAMHMGQVWRECRASGADVAEAVAVQGKGVVAFRGTVSDCDWETRDGFTYGNVTIAGGGAFAGDEYRIWLKNENMIGRLNGAVHATIPDLICMIDTETSAPITNPNYFSGQNVAVIVLPAPEPFTTQRGLEAFGPSYIGLDQAYKPAVA
ncbi:DUF917 domain-containing protein [uncultured Shimia sp.]|uniref:DUF917 domain-containing protein n=1 Tax=uncultured Shimia sp. TaxID=573152 RepID=UPI00262EF5FE|nr:DUF917 domain-containing protein [uncultured Shimia sp.]